MGTPIRSEKDPPNPPPSPDSSGASHEPPPNPNPNPSDGRTDGEPEGEAARNARYIGILEDTLREQNRTISQLNAQVTAKPTREEPAPPPPDPAVARQEFYNDPMSATRRIVGDALKETVAPLLDFVNEMKGQGVAGRLKTQLKADPRFAPYWDDAVDRGIDDAVSKLQPGQLNEMTMQGIVVQIIGLKTMGLLPGSSAPAPRAPNPNPDPNSAPRVSTQPAHMRPSSPPAPSAGNGKKVLRPLTENEERLRRENKMSHEEYLFWLDVPPSQVATAKFVPSGDK